MTFTKRHDLTGIARTLFEGNPNAMISDYIRTLIALESVDFQEVRQVIEEVWDLRDRQFAAGYARA